MTPELERVDGKGDKQSVSEWPCSCDLHLRLHLQLDLDLVLAGWSTVDGRYSQSIDDDGDACS